jgi:hypothetical protein
VGRRGGERRARSGERKQRGVDDGASVVVALGGDVHDDGGERAQEGEQGTQVVHGLGLVPWRQRRQRPWLSSPLRITADGPAIGLLTSPRPSRLTVRGFCDSTSLEPKNEIEFTVE